MTDCACGSKQIYPACCGRFISGEQVASTPEELMRSRYTAYTEANIPYIIKTMKSPAADGFNTAEARAWALSVQWVKLDVLQTTYAGDQGQVEFIAYFRSGQQNQIIHELSFFQRIDGAWFYTDGRLS